MSIEQTVEPPREPTAAPPISSAAKLPRPAVPSRAASDQRPLDTLPPAPTPSNEAVAASEPAAAKKGPPPPRPTGKKPAPVLRARRRSSDGTEAGSAAGKTLSASAGPAKGSWATQADAEAPTPALSGVAALRARFDAGQASTATPRGDKPSSTETSTSGRIATPIATPRSSHPPSPERTPSASAPAVVIERGDTEIMQSRAALRSVSPGPAAADGGRLTPRASGTRSRAGSGASARSVSRAMAAPCLAVEVDAAVASGRMEEATGGKDGSAPPGKTKPAIPPRAAPSASTPVSRTSADSVSSLASEGREPLVHSSSAAPAEAEADTRSDSRRPSAPRALGPPPIPANRPAPTSPRPQAQAQEERTGALPPRLPVRQRTMPPALNGTKESISADTSATLAQTPLEPPPMPTRNRAQTTAAAMLPSASSSGSLSGIAALPPPPSRNVTPRISRVAAAPREASSDDDDVAADDVEQQGSIGMAAPLTTALRRALDEYPDTTRAYRQPPEFVPQQMISTPTTHVHCFATFGSTLCIGSHHVKIFDLTLGDTKAVLTIELRSTGLDFRGKDPKITSMCFRSPMPGQEEGRYVWCGTSHGHLWEFDVLTGNVTDTKAGAHGSAITHIFRHKQWMMTVDEGGKVHVFGPDPANFEGAAVAIASNAVRTIRTSDKNNFAAMIGHQLWTSSGPLTRSTTNATLRGPTIRVFEPISATNTVGQTTFTSEWTGAVTAAAVIPFKAGEVYLGHEGGFISVFSQADLTCLRVLKIWPSDILSVEGVGERLWVGGRGGNISVYDVSSQPWVATNLWNAHECVMPCCDQSPQFLTNPSAITRCTKYTQIQLLLSTAAATSSGHGLETLCTPGTAYWL